MAIRPVWLQFRSDNSIATTGTSIVDLLATHLDQLQISSRTVVAIKGSMGVRASTTLVSPDIFDIQAGFFVGNSNLVAADVPSLTTDGEVNPGFMWRRQVIGVTSGDATNSLQVFSDNYDFDVRSKRSLTGIGDQTLWLQVRVSAAATVGTCTISGQILLAQKS